MELCFPIKATIFTLVNKFNDKILVIQIYSIAISTWNKYPKFNESPNVRNKKLSETWEKCPFSRKSRKQWVLLLVLLPGDLIAITISKQRLLTPIVRSRMSRDIRCGIHLVRLHMYICVYTYMYVYIYIKQYKTLIYYNVPRQWRILYRTITQNYVVIVRDKPAFRENVAQWCIGVQFRAIISRNPLTSIRIKFFN